MDQEQKLRELIRKTIREMMSEISTTGNVAGYLTPNAFVGDKHDNTSKVKKLAKRIGYTLTSRGQSDTKRGDKLQEKYDSLKKKLDTVNENYYYQYKNDPSKTPHQKIGTAIAEVNRQLKLMERVLKMNHRLKQEYGVSNENLWKRTNNQMMKLEGKLIELAGRIREMRG
jgi:hypothetical protein